MSLANQCQQSVQVFQRSNRITSQLSKMPTNFLKHNTKTEDAKDAVYYHDSDIHNNLSVISRQDQCT